MQNTVIVADGKNTTLRNIFCVTQQTETKQKEIQNICAARLGQPLADRYLQTVLKPVRLTIRCN